MPDLERTNECSLLLVVVFPPEDGGEGSSFVNVPWRTMPGRSIEAGEAGDCVREAVDEWRDLELGLPPPLLKLLGLFSELLPTEVFKLLLGDFGDVFGSLFLAAAFACLKAMARVPRTSLGD